MLDVTPERLAAGKMENCFRDASDHIERYLIEGATRLSGAAEIATTHLMCRSLADLRAGQYLACEGFPLQMYSLVRPAIESINLIELFAQNPEMATQWAEGDHLQFKPANVRKLLRLGGDPVYSWMCEHSHPRFAGFQLTTYLVTDSQGRQTMRPHIGGLPLEHPKALIATTAPGNVLCLLARALGHCTVKKEIAFTWPAVVRAVGETVLPGYEAVYRVLREHGLPDNTSAALLDSMREAIARGQRWKRSSRRPGTVNRRPSGPTRYDMNSAFGELLAAVDEIKRHHDREHDHEDHADEQRDAR
jgi:hypothetical protein